MSTAPEKVSDEAFRRLVLLQAIAKSIPKDARDHLAAGRAYEIEAAVSGRVDGVETGDRVAGALTVGHDLSKAASSGPDMKRMVAYLLGKMWPSTRNKILRDLPVFVEATGGELPEVNQEIVDASELMLKKLRRSKPTTKRGAVTFKKRK